MKIVPLDEIRQVLDWDDAIASIENGFRAFSAGKADLAAVGHLVFPAVDGDCHVKCASMAEADVFVVKVATGFYRNPSLGLPVSDGCMTLLDSTTGQPRCLLLDEGWLTNMRTAMAGAIAARRVRGPRTGPIGIVGAGTQAHLQALLIAHVTGIRDVTIWARNAERSRALAATLAADGLAASATADLWKLCAEAALVVTTTPSTNPILSEPMLPPGSRVIAIGADAPGKQELETALVAAADLVVVDSREQCFDHGEAGWAARAGSLNLDRVFELGQILDGGPDIPADGRVIVDLTGIAVQDLQIARQVWEKWLRRRPSGKAALA